jgi:SM-20-related protein
MKHAIAVALWVFVAATFAIAESHKDCEHRGGILPCSLSKTIEHVSGLSLRRRRDNKEGSSMLQPHSVVTADHASPILDFGKLESEPLNTDPFQYVVVSGFIHPDWEDRLIADFPAIHKGGSFPLSTLDVGVEFTKLIEAMNGDEFRRAVEQKFSMSLEGHPTMFTVRGKCRSSDGKIHTDSESKLITVLLYMNPRWDTDGGRLRLLRSGTDLEDVAAEVPPTIGTLLVFRRCENSYHGHLPFDGPRKVVQMNWVIDEKTVAREAKRHRWSAAIKRLGLS